MSLGLRELEDEFAGLAMQTLLLKNEDKNKLPITLAREAYRMADAMLIVRSEVRKKRSEQNSDYEYRPLD